MVWPPPALAPCSMMSPISLRISLSTHRAAASARSCRSSPRRTDAPRERPRTLLPSSRLTAARMTGLLTSSAALSPPLPAPAAAGASGASSSSSGVAITTRVAMTSSTAPASSLIVIVGVAGPAFTVAGLSAAGALSAPAAAAPPAPAATISIPGFFDFFHDHMLRNLGFFLALSPLSGLTDLDDAVVSGDVTGVGCGVVVTGLDCFGGSAAFVVVKSRSSAASRAPLTVLGPPPLPKPRPETCRICFTENVLRLDGGGDS
mmetsp:Transcript_25664/g.67322  ORF Transcript_25664/g.67322 Transcript_25664/m.67322 type:complete len:261 (+) Transcript_25664:877-1659(+)